MTATRGLIARRAAVTAEQAADDAAATAATARAAARAARAVRAATASAAAAAVAQAAARTMEAVQAHADDLAAAIAVAPSTSVAKTERTALAAVLAARAALAAATAAVATTSAAAAAAMEDDVLDAALAVQALSTATARDLAADTIVRGAAAARAARADLATADAATHRLHEANRQLERAGLHDHMIAVALQQAMLTRLPEPEDLQLAARYLTAADHGQVGGDWYDALVLRPGTTTLVIGDVIGHDVTAAAAMGQLRNLLRALAWERNHPPCDVIARLDRAARDLRIDTAATMILLNIEPPPPDQPASAATLRWSNAGHPAPVLIHADGTAVLLDESTDVMLGITPDSTRTDHTHPVPPGATLLLYTDGLVETRARSIDIGQQRLLDTARAHHRLPPGDLLDTILTDMVSDRPGDDVAVLAARFPTPRSPYTPCRGATGDPSTATDRG